MSIFSPTPLNDDKREPLPAEEFRVLDKMAQKIVEWRMSAPAIMTIEGFRPMNYIGSQMMVFSAPIFEPLLEMFFKFEDYDLLRQAMERRENVENVLLMIERYDAHQAVYDRMVKKFLKAERKKWKWYQRWPGINRPKLDPPDEIKLYDWRSKAQKENREAFLKKEDDKQSTDDVS